MARKRAVPSGRKKAAATVVPPKKAAKPALAAKAPAPPAKRKSPRHCNTLDGKQWLQNSISVWSDIRKTAEESRLKHPALFPSMLVERLIQCFLHPGGEIILDPFAGSGSTLVAAERAGKRGIGLELSPEYVALCLRRLAQSPQLSLAFDQATVAEPAGGSVVYQASATDLLRLVPPASVDLCVTSPPYWDILNQRRSADLKTVRHYGNLEHDLGTVADYGAFLDELTGVFTDVLQVLKPGAYCCIALMDLRKKDKFYPFHSDLASRLVSAGFVYDDLIIWNRQSEYNNLKPLGYPAVFRINKVHEFVLLMQKPKAKADSQKELDPRRPTKGHEEE